MLWREAVINAIHRYNERHGTNIVKRQIFINEEIEEILTTTNSYGQTPTQTLSRILQELRDEGFLAFVNHGEYVLLDRPISVEKEDLPDNVLDQAIVNDMLTIDNVIVSDERVFIRQRRGQERLHRLTLLNYNNECALCDISDKGFLIASHIVRWADDPEKRGSLSNVICLCRFHDALFESGYISLADDLSVLKRKNVTSMILKKVLFATSDFKFPKSHYPTFRIEQMCFGN